MHVHLLFLEFKEAFKIFDVDNSQTITTDELLLVMKNLGMMATKDEVKDMLSEVDEDGTLAENVTEKGGVGYLRDTYTSFSFSSPLAFPVLHLGMRAV